MKKIVILLILLAFSMAGLSCGGGAGSSSSPHGENPGVPTIVRLLPSHYIALTNSVITLHAKVLDGNGAPVKNIPVIFTNISPIGTLSATTANTNSSGLATVTIKSTQTGFATIQAEVNKGVSNVRDKKTVFFSSTLSLSPFMYLDVDGNNNQIYNETSDVDLFEGGDANDNQVIVRATVYNKYGQRASGSTVTFGADSTEATFPNGNTATTNSSGEASVLVKVTPMTIRNLQTVLNITASADNGAAGLVSLFLQPVQITGITVTANPSVVAPNGPSTVSAAVTMLNALPVPDGSTVSFVASCGTVDPFAQTTNGLATAKFTAPSTVPSSPCRVTASIAGLPSSITNNYADITVTTALSVLPTPQTVNGLTGGTVSFIISGGVAPYTVTSGNKAVACNSTDTDCSDAEDSGTWIVDTKDSSGNYSFTVTVPANTAAQNLVLTVRDAAATSVSATVAISGTALSVQPGTVTIDGTNGGPVTFTIFGGVPPYDVFPNNADSNFIPDTTHVISSGLPFKVTVPASTPATTIIYTVRDSAASTTTGTLNITAPVPAQLTINPATVTVQGTADATDNVTFTITNGTSPFSVVSSNTAVVSVGTITTTGFTIDPKVVAASTSVTLTVIDHLGVSQTVSVTVTPQSSSMVLNPATIAVTAGTPAAIHIIGGLPGYTVYSSNLAVATIPSYTSPSTTINVTTLTAGTSTIYVVDSDGKTATATVTVLGTVPDFTIGCTALPTFTLNTFANSTCTITSLNGFNSGVTLGCAGLPANVTCVFSQSPATPPPGLATQSTLTVTVGAAAIPGTHSFNVEGTSGGTTHVSVMNLNIFGASPTSGTIAGINNDAVGNCTEAVPNATDDLTFLISGGQPPYSVSSNNIVVIPTCALNLAGGTLVVDPSNVGANTDVVITVSDSAAVPNTFDIPITVTP